jgi:histidyl-tRNA synthetase
MQIIRGFRDILPENIKLWQKVEKEAKQLFEDFGFNEIRLPILEKTEVFARSIGEATDIVEKEMYTFPDIKGHKLTLRPEATASIVRAYVQYKMYASDPVRKFYTIGPMFRREKPQKGRYRQFYQIDAEIFGVESAYVDANLIFLLNELFKRLGLSGLKAHINSLGCPECRPDFQKALLTLLESKKDMLCTDCLRRKDSNPLRTLDCKNPQCKEALKDAPTNLDFLCKECEDHFNIVKTSLKKQKVDFIEDKTLVRGLDYYTRTAFEIQTSSLGAQSAVAGGGRYDLLVKEMGGPDIPAIGFAIGFDRLVQVMEALDKKVDDQELDLFIIALGDSAIEAGYHWSTDLNLKGIRTEIDYRNKSLKSLMKRADKLGAKNVLIAGEKEIKENALILRNMDTREQITIDSDDPVARITEFFKKNN